MKLMSAVTRAGASLLVGVFFFLSLSASAQTAPSAIWSVNGHASTVTDVAISADGRLMASASFDHSIKVWSVADGALLAVLSGHAAEVKSVAFSRDGSMLASGSYDRTVKGLASHFVWINRTKESLTLDLKRPEASDVLCRLLSRADVLIHNLAPGAMGRLGFPSSALHEQYPRLVVCAISGYGAEGPYRDKTAYDLLVQSEAGLVSITGTPEVPSKVGVSIADIAAGMYAFSGILAALLRRERTGAGAVLDISMFDALAEWMGYPAYYTGYGGTPLPRSGAAHAAIAP